MSDTINWQLHNCGSSDRSFTIASEVPFTVLAGERFDIVDLKCGDVQDPLLSNRLNVDISSFKAFAVNPQVVVDHGVIHARVLRVEEDTV